VHHSLTCQKQVAKYERKFKINNSFVAYTLMASLTMHVPAVCQEQANNVTANPNASMFNRNNRTMI
jgi:hypothetical protein